ncbi:MAG: PAS domain S-box protein, partial [Rhodospirillales bacterium]|nr:PAS domain S-box protein [Rhodospirillales bacterium]
VIVRDVSSNPAFAPWRESAIKRGFSAVASFPLKTMNGVVGALNVYASMAEAIVFDVREIELLENLAGQLAYGIDALRERDLKAFSENLIESKRKFQAVVDDQNELLCRFTTDGALTFVNRAFAAFFGYEPAAIIGKNLPSLFPDVNGKRLLKDLIAGIEADQKVIEAEQKVKVRGGETAIILWRSRGFFNDRNKLVEIQSVGTDVTLMKMQARKLRTSEQRLQLIFNSAVDGIFTLDEHGVINSVNISFERIFRYSAFEIVGKHFESLLSEGERKAFRQSFASAREKGAAKEQFEGMAITGIRKGGEAFPLELAVSMVVGEDGAFVCSGIARDVSLRVRQEAELRKLSSAVEASPAMVLITDRNGMVEYVNPRFTEISGYEVEDIIGGTPSLLGSGEMGKDHYLDMWKTLARGEVWRGEFHNKRKNGEMYWVSAAISPVASEQGPTTHFVAVEEDITDRKAAEADLKAAKELADKANKAKSEFLSSMSHELRTPLNAILGFSQLMEYDVTEPLTARQRESVTQIKKGGDHLLELINEVLDLAKVEAGKVSLSIEDVEPGPVFDECLSFIGSMAGKKGISINDAVSGTDIPVVRCDRTRFKQVILNFLSNAVKYNRDGGSLTLSVNQDDDATLMISVSDTGFGIPEDKQADVFQPFSRLGAEATDIEGTGIGLTITKQLVELMGGTIGFESVVDQGSTFWIRLPLADITSAPATDEAVKASVSTGDMGSLVEGEHLILYVEDNPANLRLMERLIEQIPDVELISAHNAELGVELAESRQPDVIIMDIHLPGMNGFDALKILQEKDETSHIPVIALSAAALKPDIEKGMKAGFLDYLTKPIVVNELINAVNRGLSLNDKAGGKRNSSVA